MKTEISIQISRYSELLTFHALKCEPDTDQTVRAAPAISAIDLASRHIMPELLANFRADKVTVCNALTNQAISTR